MLSLGELFVQLGVVGDVQPLQEAIDKTKEQISLAEKQLKLDKLRAKALEDIRKAQTKTEKQGVAKRYNQEKTLVLQKAELSGMQKQLAAGKAVAGNLGAMVTGFIGVAGAIAAAGIALNKLADDLTSNNQAWIDFKRTTELGLENLQKYAGVASVLDKSLGMEGAAGSIAQLNDRLFELRLTGEGARGFQLAGIDPRGLDAFGVLERLRDRVAGMNNTAASYLLRQMGLDPKLLPLLRMSRDEFEELGETINRYQLTDEQREKIQQLNTQLSIADMKLKYLKDRISLSLTPLAVTMKESFVRIAEMFVKFAAGIKNMSVSWHAFTVALTLGLARLERVQIFFKGLLTGLNGLIRGLPIVGRYFGEFGSIVARALLPLTALYLLLDDLAVYFEGGDSLIGRVIDWGSEKGAEIGDAFKKMFGGDFAGGLSDLGNTILESINDMLKTIANLLERLINILSFGLLDKLKGSGIWQKLFPSVDDAAKNMGINLNKKPTDKKADKKADATGTGNEPVYKTALADTWVYQMATMPDEPQLTTEGATRGIISPITNQAIDNSNNSVKNTDNKTTIAMTNYIQTDQPAQNIKNELDFINQRYAYG